MKQIKKYLSKRRFIKAVGESMYKELHEKQGIDTTIITQGGRTWYINWRKRLIKVGE